MQPAGDTTAHRPGPARSYGAPGTEAEPVDGQIDAAVNVPDAWANRTPGTVIPPDSSASEAQIDDGN